MVEMVAAFVESLSEEEALELTHELDRRRAKLDLLQERAFARLSELRGSAQAELPIAWPIPESRAS